MELETFFLVLLCALLRGIGTEATPGVPDAPVLAITRLNNGDVFTAEGDECTEDETCVGLSSGTAILSGVEDLTAPKGSCNCQCHQHLPTFREDMHVCVDDIHECMLAPFVSGSTSQKIPFVFLPLKGQIIHPSKEISFTDVQTPLCIVSGAQFLTDSGWKDLKNPVDSDVPFRLYRDEGRTFLQWVGESLLRKQMSGRLVLVRLVCREMASPEDSSTTQGSTVFNPCVAFRVVGTPTKYLQNVSEVSFSADAHVVPDGEAEGLSISEYVAIGIASILLGLIYVSSVFLYLHIRRRRRDFDKKSNRRDDQSITTVEEGIVKNNPLLGLGRHFSNCDNTFSESGSSETDMHSDSLKKHEDRKKNFHLTSAMIHQGKSYFDASVYTSKGMCDSLQHDLPSIERLPEENVAIIETMEGREDRPDTVRTITGTTRRKLYFNPAYFEPEMLLAPPPAAIEFLSKIREVINIAKQKMACKRYTPNLIEIPEEEENENSTGYDLVLFSEATRRNSVISLKRENSRKKACGGCPSCNTKDLQNLYGKLPEYPSARACKNCSLLPAPVGDSKQRSIQRWLEDVPILKGSSSGTETSPSDVSPNGIIQQRKHLRSPTRSLSPETERPFRALSPRPASERACSPTASLNSAGNASISARSQPSAKPRRCTTREKPAKARRKMVPAVVKPSTPPPPLPVDNNNNGGSSNESESAHAAITTPLEEENSSLLQEPSAAMPTITRRNMKAVINEFSAQHGLSIPKSIETSEDVSSSASSPEFAVKRAYESDSLEKMRRKNVNSHSGKGFSTVTEYMETGSSSQPSPSLSSGLPMTEEMTISNDLISKDSTKSREDTSGFEDYEVILVQRDALEEQEKQRDDSETLLYKLPELLQRSNGYSLVSEVYVNNGYNYESVPSSPGESNCSTLVKPTAIKYKQEEDKPGALTIEVEDCPDNYIRVEDSDSFEPDTLDRKPVKTTLSRFMCTNKSDEFIDSLERPAQGKVIIMQSRSSFRKDDDEESVRSKTPEPPKSPVLGSGFTRKFGSLREIYEFKTKHNLRRASTENINFCVQPQQQPQVQQQIIKNFEVDNRDYEGRMLTLEQRHCRRQRCIEKPSSGVLPKIQIPPDVIPPPPHDNSPIYEQPKPPRRVGTGKPPLPPKNGIGRSTATITNTTITTTSQHQQKAPGEGDAPGIPASPCSEKSFGVASSCPSGGTSASPYSSDYETFAPGEQQQIHAGTVILDESQLRVLTRLIDAPTDVVVRMKNAINNRQYVPPGAPKLHHAKRIIGEDLNNNDSFYNNNERNQQKDALKRAWVKAVNENDSKKNSGRGDYYNRVVHDSGYLSTDSYETPKRMFSKNNHLPPDSEKEVSAGGSETDESLGDGQSESGAESIETHSVFFGVPYVLGSGGSVECKESKCHQVNRPNTDDTKGSVDDYASTDSETTSYTTVVPIAGNRNALKRTNSLRSAIFLRK